MDFSLFVPWIGECLSSDTSDSPVLYSCQFITRFSSFVKLNTNFVWYRWHAAGNNIDMRSACAAAVDWLEPICCANKARYLNTRLYWVRCNLCNLYRLHGMIASSFNGFIFLPLHEMSSIFSLHLQRFISFEKRKTVWSLYFQLFWNCDPFR
jgi:hypothetical protein